MVDFNFHVNVETDDVTGDVLAVYFQIRKGKVHRTEEFSGGNVFADYDRLGKLLGVEVVGHCRLSVVDRIAAEESTEVRNRMKRFMKRSGPRMMVAT
jgi:uncharacterized protein YuzE